MPGQLRILRRRIDASGLQALQARLRRHSGLPSLSMAILASAFRSIAALSASQGRDNRFLCAALGVALPADRGAGPLLQNITSLLPLLATVEEAADRDRLTCALHKQMRERIASGIDLGLLELTAYFGRRQRQARFALEVAIRYMFSLWFAFFRSMDQLGRTFLGCPIAEVFSVGPAWSPMGLTLLVNQYNEQLFLQATYAPDALSEQQAQEFLDWVVTDLLT
jgi:hypothetical protein